LLNDVALAAFTQADAKSRNDDDDDDDDDDADNARRRVASRRAATRATGFRERGICGRAVRY
jgi:hypothetical protein